MEVSNDGEYSPSTSEVYIVGVYWRIEFIIVVTKGRRSQPNVRGNMEVVKLNELGISLVFSEWK